jgi:disintegrin and metalloproteinase domain-containing protein 17
MAAFQYPLVCLMAVAMMIAPIAISASVKGVETPPAPAVHYLMHFEQVHLSGEALMEKHERHRRKVLTMEGVVEPVKIDFSAYGKDFNLELRQNAELFIDGAVAVRVHTDAGIETSPLDTSPWYTGHLKGDPASVVEGRIQDGQLHCSVFTGEGVTYRLEPTHKHFKGKQQFSHVIFPFSAVRDVAKPPGTPANQSWCGCGASGFHEEHEAHDHQEHYDSPLRRMASEIKERSRRAFPVKNTCEFGLYSDHRFYSDSAFGQSNVSTTTSAMIEQLSFAAAIYASTNFDLRTGVDFVGFSPVHALAAVTVFTTPTATGNPWETISTSSTDFLNQAKKLPNMARCLNAGFTAISFDGGVLGLAPVGVACTGNGDGNKVSISTGYSFDTVAQFSQRAVVFTHEVGHNWGISHDDSCSSYCSTHASECDGIAYTGGAAKRTL